MTSQKPLYKTKMNSNSNKGERDITGFTTNNYCTGTCQEPSAANVMAPRLTLKKILVVTHPIPEIRTVSYPPMISLNSCNNVLQQYVDIIKSTNNLNLKQLIQLKHHLYYTTSLTTHLLMIRVIKNSLFFKFNINEIFIYVTFINIKIVIAVV